MDADHLSAVQRMEMLVQQWEEVADRRAIFLKCYQLMTMNMQTAIQAGEFNDTEWVEKLLEHFAGYYFQALLAFEGNDPLTPLPWQIAFAATQRDDLSIIQHLVLGVNAHINYDLVLAEVDMLEPEWAELDSETYQQRHQDHHLVNAVIAMTIDSVQDTIIEAQEPHWDILDRLLGPVDEWLISKLITSWREEVWERAVITLNRDDGDRRKQLEQQLSGQVAERARLILSL
jgi:hypothetical protein